MSNNKEKVGEGKLVVYAYELIDTATGDVLFKASAEAPDVMIYGNDSQVVPGLLEVLRDKEADDKFDVELKPAAAFGEVDPDIIMHIPNDAFLNAEGELPKELKIGAELPMMTQAGQVVTGKVLEINSTDVVMDFNHPFAGKTVRFKGEVLEVRTPTPEEAEALSGHGGCGCGCNHDDCGNGEGNCGCGSGCGGCH